MPAASTIAPAMPATMLSLVDPQLGNGGGGLFPFAAAAADPSQLMMMFAGCHQAGVAHAQQQNLQDFRLREERQAAREQWEFELLRAQQQQDAAPQQQDAERSVALSNTGKVFPCFAMSHSKTAAAQLF